MLLNLALFVPMKKHEEKSLNVSNRRRAIKGRSTLEIHRLGPHPIIQHFLERLDVARILDKHIHSNRTGILSHGTAICVLVHNVLVSQDPLYRLKEWVAQLDAPALGIAPDKKDVINDDRMGRALDQLAEYGGRGVFFQLALRMIKLFRLETSRIHFDTTSFSFTGQYNSSNESPRICHGKSKRRRPDLKQLVFGLNVTSDGAVPISHKVYSGNQTDDTLHRDNLDALRDLLARDDIVYVADCKLCTKDNLKHIQDFGGQFVTVMPRTRKEDADFREKIRYKAARWRTILTVENPKKAGETETYSTCNSDAKTDDGFRIVWIKSSAKVVLDRKKRENQLEKAKAALNDLNGRLNQRYLKTRKQIKNAIAKILKQYQCEEILNVTINSKVVTQYKRVRSGRLKKGVPQKPKKTKSKTVYDIEFKPKTVRLRQERNTDGIFPLVTNIPKKSGAREVLQIYRYQPYIERRFQNLKTEYSVEPACLKTPKRIVGFIHVCFIALMVGALIEREIRQRMAEEDIESIPVYPEARECRAPTSPRLFDLFNHVEWFRTIAGETEVSYPVELSDMQREVLRLLGVPKNGYAIPATE